MPKEITYKAFKDLGLDYYKGMEGVFFLQRKNDEGFMLTDQRGVGIFDRESGDKE